MNDLLVILGIESWKPALDSLLLPPVPFLVLILVGARLMFRRRLIAWSLILTGTVGIWLMCTAAAGMLLTNVLLIPPRALGASDIADLKKQPKTAIVVLGAGRKLLSPEYGLSNLKPLTMERLRYGIWLAKETSLPLAYSGGTGHGAPQGPSEAEIATRIAEREFGRPLKWSEGQSRDTHENAMRTLPMLHDEGIETIVLVTHGFHMRRALAAFERAKQRTGISMTIVPAPMGLDPSARYDAVSFLPSVDGYEMTRIALHEWLGRLAGA